MTLPNLIFNPRRRRSFTLVELLTVTLVIGVLAGMVLFAMGAAQERAREQKTRTMIATLDRLLMERWNQFLNRRVTPIQLNSADQLEFTEGNVKNAIQAMSDPSSDRSAAAKMILDGLRLTQKIEFPDRWSDINDELGAPDKSRIPLHFRSATWVAYKNYWSSLWDELKDGKHGGNDPDARANLREFQGAECLYMIITFGTGDGRMGEYFKDGDTGDLDGDGYLEFHDGWGTPISFIRWPAGFTSERQPGDPATDPDPFDPQMADYDDSDVQAGPNALRGFRVVPLIYSAGPDRRFDIYKGNSEADDDLPIDPYYVVPADQTGLNRSLQIGTPIDANNNDENDQNGSAPGNGIQEWQDNIHNHLINS